jgi:hypothetical protein
VARAKEQGKNVADLLNEAMLMYLEGSSAPNSNVMETKKLILSGSVILSKSDILGLHEELGPFQLENSGELTFDKDVDRETLHKIERIYNTGKLRVPKPVHHIALLRVGHVRGQIEKY